MRALLLTIVFALAVAMPAAAATAPSATTGPVSSVGPTSATVTGTVNPNGTATSWFFQYGTSTSYGSQTASTNAGSGTSSVPVSANLSGLKAGTTYHYRVVAKSSTAGTTNGADGILTTSSAPSAVTGSASSVTSTSATLNGTVNPNGRQTTWYFEYGTSTSYGTKTASKDAGGGTSAVAVSASATGLHTGRTYHFRLVATSDAGTARGSDQTFFPTSSPSATTKAASSIGDTSAKLNASVTPNGLATTAYFEYGTSTSYGAKSATVSLGSGTSAKSVTVSVTGLAGSTTYHTRVVAISSAGTSFGADIAFTTTGAPSAHTNAATAIGPTNATLSGTLNPNGHSTSWFFEWGTSTAYGTRSATKSAGSGTSTVSVSVPVSGLVPGTTYHARLVTSNGIGTVSGGDVAFSTAGPAVTLAPAAPLVVAGRPVRLVGAIATKQANQSVAVFAQRYGSTSFVAVATVLTGPNGFWSLSVRPRIATAYKAMFNGSASAVRLVGVRPAVTFRAVAHHRGRFTAHVSAARSFAHRFVQVQRHKLNGGWVAIARVRLNAFGTAVFTPHLRKGLSTLRVTISVSQAGPGYLAGYSRWLTVRR